MQRKIHKSKVHPIKCRKGHKKKQRFSSTLSLTSELDGDGWSTPRPGRFTHGNYPVPTAQESGWTPGPLWMGAGNLATTAIRSPDRRTRSELLYRLDYAGPQNNSQTRRQTQVHQARFEAQIYVMGYASEKLRAQGTASFHAGRSLVN